MDCTIYVAKTKALISFAVTAKLICVFVFAYLKSRFSHNKAHFCSEKEFCSKAISTALFLHFKHEICLPVCVYLCQMYYGITRF